MTPEKLHLLLNHVPIHGLFFATLAIVAGLFLKSRKVVLTGVALTLLSSLSIPIIMGSGEAAYERYKYDPILSDMMTMPGMHAALEHYENAEKGAKATYLLILVSAATLAIAKWKEKWLKIAIGILLVVSILSLILNIWIANSGGKVRRPDFASVDHTMLTDHNDSFFLFS